MSVIERHIAGGGDRQKAAKSDAKVNSRFLAISELVARAPEILASDDPEATLNAHAKSDAPVKCQKAALLVLQLHGF
jgi:hypothetical protein